MSTDSFHAPARRAGRLRRSDAEIHFEVTGAGPALVFAHGLGGNHLSWWQQVGHFASRFTCVTFAHRGFGPSSAVPGGPDPADFADDLAALVDHLGIDRFHLVAQSMGGWTGVEFGLKYPGRLAGLVLANTTGSIDPALAGEATAARLSTWQAGIGAVLADLAARGILAAGGERMAREQPALHLLYRHIDETRGEVAREVIRARIFAMRTRHPQELARLGCPILFIVGREDVVIPPFAEDAVAAMVPGARVVGIENAGHSAYFEQAAPFNQAIDQFLGATASAPTGAR